MKNEKNYMGFLIIKIQQILKRFGGTKTLAKTSYFWGSAKVFGFWAQWALASNYNWGDDKRFWPKNWREMLKRKTNFSGQFSFHHITNSSMKLWSLIQI